MPYKARINIGNYPAGSIVPDEKAELWQKMYVEDPTEFFTDKVEEVKPIPKKSDLDINNDGVFDRKDKQIAGKVLKSKIKGR